MMNDVGWETTMRKQELQRRGLLTMQCDVMGTDKLVTHCDVPGTQ